ncbi:MAG: RNA methyltransferase [Cyclobacteriaceae bacterium]|nr:RNA methyltransferase [Cyclobacteriaceae bacterium]
MRKLRNDELNRLTGEEIKKVDKNPLVIVLDNIRSRHNVGSAFRTADAFLCEKVILCGITAQPPHREIHKTALGSTETVDWKYYENSMEAVNELKMQGYKIASVEQADGSISLEKFNFNVGEKLALIFGNEVKGVLESLVEISDYVIEIPQFGTKHSINISVSIGVVIWDLISKMQR